MGPSRRVLAPGLSEASWTCLREFAADLPTLTAIADRGASAVTLAPQPLLVEPLWATVVTGRSVDAHGIAGPLRGDRLLSAHDLAVPPVWRLLEDAGLTTGTFNLRLTLRPEEVRGFMFCRDARPAIHGDLVFPPELYRPLRQRFGVWQTATAMETRTEVLIDLLRTRRWDFVLTQIPEISRVQHNDWIDRREGVRAVYAATDRAIARLIDAVGPDAVVIAFSECGAGAVRHAVQLNAWLEQMGYLRRRKRLLSKAVLAAARLYHKAKRFVPPALDVARVKMRSSAAVRVSDVDWRRTRAHSPGQSGDIVFHVPSHERRALADELRSRLLLLRDPEGRRVVEEVIPRADGLTIIWEDDAYLPVENFGDRARVFVDSPKAGVHRREGVLLACGGGIERADLGRVRTLDLVPTWLDLLGVPIPRELEGSSFAERLLASPVSRSRA